MNKKVWLLAITIFLIFISFYFYKDTENVYAQEITIDTESVSGSVLTIILVTPVPEITDDLETFESVPGTYTSYEYEMIRRTNNLEYALAILITIIVINIFLAIKNRK